MVFHVLSLFPEMIKSTASYSILGRAVSRGGISADVVDIRDYTQDVHRHVDDEPYGGGAGMLMQAQPVYDAFTAVRSRIPAGNRTKVFYLSPKARPMTQRDVRRMSQFDDLVLICGHYEGIDERVLEEIEAEPLSIGDYILTGGELAALVVMDAVSRLLDGVLHNADSAETETFAEHLLEYPQYTRPAVWNGRAVPEVLLSGNAKNIRAWRREQSVKLTRTFRPDLYERFEAEEELRARLRKDKRNGALLLNVLSSGDAVLLHLPGADAAVFDERSRTMYCCVNEPESEEALRGFLGELQTECGRRACRAVYLLARQPEAIRALLSDSGFGTDISRYDLAVYTPGLVPSRSKWKRTLSEQNPDVPAPVCEMMENAEAFLQNGQVPTALFGHGEKADAAFLSAFDVYLSDYAVFACFF